MDAVSPLASARRIVVKIGSALLIDEAGAVRSPWLAGLADDIVELRRQKKDVVIVSSGAVALGRRALGLSGKLRLEEKQAAAAAGQARLVHAYEEALRPHDIRVAQVLVTLDDAERRRRYLNARATLHTLMELGAVPVVNENDTIATEEIRYGDNDRLAAHTAQMAAADCLILLSDIDGLYTDDPNGPTPGTYIPTVREITPEIEAMAAPETASDKVGT
ncbi:MAG: glutamate 5-kinase, partial [Pseudomonadota bacterium]